MHDTQQFDRLISIAYRSAYERLLNGPRFANVVPR